jgi:hypothetical protein
MRKVTTEFSCDRCGLKIKSAKQLQRFQIVQVKYRRMNDEYVSADLCEACESELLAAVEPFFGSADLPTLHAMSRSED